MIPAKLDSSSFNPIKEKNVDSIVDWFEQHKQSFYILGWCYLRNQRQMEELFYRSIIQVQKEWPRFKGKTSFDTWVTSIFIHNCQELSGDSSLQELEDSEPRQELFKALDQLKEYEKAAIVLTYVQGFSKEEAAELLQVSAVKMKELLFSGIQSFRNEMRSGKTYNGCKEYQKDYIDYLERDMERQKKIDFEVHIYHCQQCQEDLASFQDVMFKMLNLTDRIEDLPVPSSFMENLKDRLAEREKHRQKRKMKRQRIGFAFASVFAFLIGVGFFTGSFSYVYYLLTEDDPELRAFLQQDIGQRLNLEAESNGVKIKIKGAIADNIQTLVFYEIEDTNEDNQYMMNYDDGVLVENEYEIMSRTINARYYPPDLESDVNNREKNVFQGKMSLPPLKSEMDNGTIKLTIINLQRLGRDSSEQNAMRDYDNMEYKQGEWSFEIPVTKQPSIEHALDEKIEVEGIPLRFDKLIIAPTTTILQFGINNQSLEKQIGSLNFDNLEVNNRKVKSDRYGSTYLDSQPDINWTALQAHFEPLFGEKPKEVNVQLGAVYLSVNDNKTIVLDDSQGYPQTFEYAGSTISLDKKEIGEFTEFVISNHEIENRVYEWLQFFLVSEDQMVNDSIEMNSEGMLIDKNGREYDMNKKPFPYEDIEKLRYFHTVQKIRFQGNHDLPMKLEIYGYNTTKYLDDVVTISLE